MSPSRTVTWEDPVEAAEAAAGMSGLEALEAIRDGRLPAPPMAKLLGMEPVVLAHGRAVFQATPDESHYNPIGVVHGGLAATLLDSAMGCAVQSTLPAGAGYTTLELKVNFVRPITRDTGPVRCEGRVVHDGRTVATADGRVYALETGKLLAHGSATCLVFSTNGH
ncbi:MAG TPA: PaaI family thioesterase [Thermoleophilaceae bacterium]|jgi:uncharacterized protein (TIGR00369 family)